MSSSGTEIFDKDGVQNTMITIGTIFQEISNTYVEADKQMVSMLTTPDGAIYGEGATKVLSAWDENSGTLEDFMNTFDNWAALVSGMANEFANLEEGTYEVKDSSPYTEDDIANRARDFRTTALKTTAGIEAFQNAQSAYKENHSDTKSYDANGVAYTSFRTLENGKIVETKVYKDEQGNLIAEEEHWAWNETDKKFEATTKYYSGGEIKDNQYDNTNAKSITKDDFDKKYYTDANTETIVDNYCNKYFTDYYESGELSDEAKEELEKLPKDIQEKVKEELESRKNTIDSNAINREYKDGKIQKITYKEGDETREIIYEYDKEGNISGVKYKIDNNEVSAQDFYKSSPNAESEAQTGSGNTGSDPANNQEGTPSSNTGSEPQAAQASVTVDTKNRTAEYDGYILSQEGEKNYITDTEGHKYEVKYDPNTRTYKYFDGDKEISEDVADSLNKAMAKITEDDYAKGLMVGNDKFTVDNDGNLVEKNPFNIQGAESITMTTNYGDDNQPISYTIKDQDGNTITTLTPEEYNAIMTQKGTATVKENGKTVTFDVDTKGKTITKTTSDNKGEISKETASIDENGKVTVSYKYRDAETGELADVTEKQYKNLTDGGQEGHIYNYKNGVYSDTYHDEKEQATITIEEVSDDDKIYKMTQKDGEKEITYTVGDTIVTEKQYNNLKKNSETNDEKSETTYYTLEESDSGEKVYTETTKKDGDPTKIYKEYTDHSSEEVFTEDGSTVTEYWNTEDVAKEYDYNKNATFKMTKNNKGEVTNYSYNGNEVSEDQYEKLKHPRVVNENGTTTERTVQADGKYVETTYKTGDQKKVYERIYQDTKGDETKKLTYEYKEDGDLKTITITGKSIESEYAPHQTPSLDDATKTITYNDNGTITETITTKNNKETYTSIVDEHNKKPIEYTYQNERSKTHEEYEDGKLKTKTIDNKTKQKVFEYGDEEKLKTCTVRHKEENEDNYNENIYEVYRYTDGKNPKLVARSTMVGGETYYYDEKSNTGTSNEKFNGYTFSKETINLIAENKKAPEFIAECNPGTKNTYQNFLDTCKDGDIITFGEGQYLQYDTASNLMGSTEVIITTGESAAYVVQTTPAGNKILVNVNDEDEYYYIDTLSSGASLDQYGESIGSITYEQLKIMRENYNGEGIKGYNENNINKWTVADAIRNNFDSEAYTNINGQEIAQTESATITIDGYPPNNSNLKNEGYIDGIMKDPGRIKYQLTWRGTNGYHNFVYNYNTKQYTYEDKNNGCIYIYDPVTGKVYKLN